jgi:hypothetical protein
MVSFTSLRLLLLPVQSLRDEMTRVEEDLLEADAKNRLYYLLGERTRREHMAIDQKVRAALARKLILAAACTLPAHAALAANPAVGSSVLLYYGVTRSTNTLVGHASSQQGVAGSVPHRTTAHRSVSMPYVCCLCC